MQALVEHKANINHLNIYKRTALQDAVISANNRIVTYLIEITSSKGNCDIHGNNLIFDAIANGNLDIIKKVALLKEVDINQINEDGNTVLHKEIVLKNNQLALLLMDLGANPTILDKNGKNFLFYAISKGIENISILHKAVELGCNINSKTADNTTLLMESINHFLETPKDDTAQKESHFEMIKELIKLGVNVEAVDNKEENALFYATRSENRELINLLLESSDFNLNHENFNGDTVLLLLVLGGIKNSDLIKFYLEKGADPIKENSYGKSIIEILIDIILHSQNRKELDFAYEILLNEDGEYPTVLEGLLRNCTIDINKLNSKGEPLFLNLFYTLTLNYLKF